MTAPAGCLAVIDMQRVFAEPGSPWLAPRFGEITPAVATLAGAFRPRVVFTRFIAPQAPAGAWQRYYEAWPFALQPPGARIYGLVDDFAAGAGPTVDKVTFSKWGPELARRASDAGGRLVLAGVSTDCCVLSTAVAAADAGGRGPGRRGRLRRRDRRQPPAGAGRAPAVRAAGRGGQLR